MPSEYFGFVAEPHKGGRYLVSAASMSDGLTTCSDLSGFAGSWLMREGGRFFPSPTNTTLCGIALVDATQYANRINSVIDNPYDS